MNQAATSTSPKAPAQPEPEPEVEIDAHDSQANKPTANDDLSSDPLPSNNKTAEPCAVQKYDPYLNAEYSIRPSDDKEEMKRWDDFAFDVLAPEALALTWWLDLDAKVTNFTRAAFPHGCGWQLLDKSTQAKLTAVCPNAARFLEDRMFQGAWILSNAWIWRILYENLFSPTCSGKWSGEEWASFRVRQRCLGGRVTTTDNPFNSAYHNSKNETARMMFMCHGPHTYPDRLKRIVWAEIASLSALRDHPDNNQLVDSDPDSSEDETPQRASADELGRRLSEVIEKAIRCDFVFVASKWHAVVDIACPVTGHVSGFPFDKSNGLMEPLALGPRQWRRHSKAIKGRPVDMICRPLLRMYGEPQGSLAHTKFLTHYNLPTRDELLVRRYHHLDRMLPMTVVVDQFSEAGREVHTNDESDSAEELTSYDRRKRLVLEYGQA